MSDFRICWKILSCVLIQLPIIVNGLTYSKLDDNELKDFPAEKTFQFTLSDMKTVVDKLSEMTNEVHLLKTELQTTRDQMTNEVHLLKTELQTTRDQMTNEVHLLKTELQTRRDQMTNEVHLLKTELQTTRDKLSKTTKEVDLLESKLDKIEQKTDICELLKETIKHNKLDLLRGFDVGHDALPGGRHKRIIPPTNNPVTTQLPRPNTVAFFAVMTDHQEHLGIYQTVMFQKTVTNEGNGWDSKTSTFKAPISGLYYFSANIMSHSAEDIETELVKNGQGLVSSYIGDTGNHAEGTLSAVLRLQSGDDVWIRMYNNVLVNNGNVRIYGYGWSWFSGFLISQ